MPRKLTLATALATAALLLLPAPPASAGTYTVYTCKTPSGIATTKDGWSATWPPSVPNFDTGDTTSCRDTALRMEFGATQLPVAPGTQLVWSFAAPPDVTIKFVRAIRTFNVGWPVDSGDGRPFIYDAWHDEDEGDQMEEYVGPWSAGATEASGPGAALEWGPASWKRLSFRLYCSAFWGDANCFPYRATWTLSAVALNLEDGFAPNASAFHGSLRGDGGAVRGVGELAFSATDSGGGVYRSILSIDGEEVRRAVVDGSGGSCADVEPGNGDAYEFGTPRPCPLTVDGAVSYDTRGLADGTHTIKLQLEDAAGNVALAHEGQFRTHNAPIATGAPSIGGDPRVGGLLQLDPGAWDGEPTALERRWLRCDAAGADCTPIAGAAGATYAPTQTDAYHRLVAEVSAHNASGAATARTALTAPIADADGRTSPGGPSAGNDPNPGGDPSGGGPHGTPGPGPVVPPRVDAQGVDGLSNPVAGQGGHSANGTNASRRARITIGVRRGPGGRGKRRVRIPYRGRATLVGRVTDESGRPIQGARLNVASRVRGRQWVARSSARTDAQGRLAVTLAPGPSRKVRLTYFAFADSRRFVASDTVDVDVVSPVTIRVNRHRVTSRGVVTVSGTAGGRPAPPAGVLVTLQGHQAGYGWRTFRTVRTNRGGRWSTRYRFRSSSGRFAFRAIVPEQGGHPYATGRSRAVRVTVA